MSVIIIKTRNRPMGKEIRGYDNFKIITAKKIYQTTKAVLVEYKGVQYWLPLSQVQTTNLNTTDDLKINIPMWLAKIKKIF